MNDAALGTLLVRADASAGLGTGHVMRCLALAQRWRDAGGTATFLMAEPPLPGDAAVPPEGLGSTVPSRVVSRLEREGVRALRVAARAGTLEDAAELASAAADVRAAWVVVDGYHFDAAYRHALRERGLRVLVVDDDGRAGAYAADVVLNQNLGAKETLYAHREPSTQLLLGTRYALLRREFDAHRCAQRAIPERARRLLVSLGGADAANVSLTVVRALDRLGRRDLEAVVLVGSANPHERALREAAARCPGSVHVEMDVTDVASRMAWADVAVLGAGIASWEACFMGLPALVVTLADNQRPIAEALAAAGTAVNLGWHAELLPDMVAGALELLLDDPARQRALSRAGRERVDGRGAARVLAHLGAAPLSLRPAGEADRELLFRWANDPAARGVSFTSVPIPWEDHVRWFDAKRADPSCALYVAFAEDLPVGQVRFDARGDEAVISVSLDQAFRAAGYGMRLIREGSRRVLAERPGLRRIHAFVRPDNRASERAFAKAGYAPGGTTEVEGCCALDLVLRRDT